MSAPADPSAPNAAPSAAPPNAPAEGVNRENPWPGLAPFDEAWQDYFFGRDAESAELLRYIQRETLTILFGQSGLGKTSLLKAGLFPLLRKAELFPMYIRLNHSEKAADLVEQVKAVFADAFDSHELEGPVPEPGETYWAYLHRRDLNFWNQKNRLVTPILVFDQFEEIFTLGRSSPAADARSKRFIQELSDLIENRVPQALEDAIDAGKAKSSDYDFENSGCKIVLSLREDYLPELEGLRKTMRSVMHNRMRLQRMNGQQAWEVVKRAGRDLVEDDVADRIVRFVAASAGSEASGIEPLEELRVEPALLSLVCSELNDRRLAQGQPRITADLVATNRREIFMQFYEKAIGDLPPEARRFIEDRLITRAGQRNSIAMDNALAEPGINRDLLDLLVARRLLRFEERMGQTWVEITHDVLIEPVRAGLESRRQREAVAEAQAREQEAKRKLGQQKKRMIVLAGIGLLACGFIVVIGLLMVAIHARRRIEVERQYAVDQETAAKKNLDTANSYKADAQHWLNLYFRGEIQKAIDATPPQSDLAEQAIAKGIEKEAMDHTSVLSMMIPPRPFVAEQIISDQSILPADSRNASPPQIVYSFDGRLLAVLAMHQLHLFQFSADGGRWVPDSRTIDLRTKDQFLAIAFHPRSTVLAVETATAKIICWNYETNALQTIPIPAAQSLPAKSNSNLPLGGSHDGKNPPAPDRTGDSFSFTGEAKTEKTATPATTWPMIFKADGTALIVGRADQSIVALPIPDADHPATTQPSKIEYQPLQQKTTAPGESYFSQTTSSGKPWEWFSLLDGGEILLGRSEGQTALWRTRDGTLIGSLNTPTIESILGADNDEAIRLQIQPAKTTNVFANNARSLLQFGGTAIKAFARGPSPGLAAVAGADKMIVVYSPRAVQQLRQREDILGLAYRPDGLEIAAVLADGSISLWQLAPDRALNPPVIRAGADPVAISPDGAHLASREYGGIIVERDVKTGRPSGVWRAPEGLRAIGFREGRVIIAAVAATGRDCVITDPQGDSKIAAVPIDQTIRGCWFSSDGAKLAMTTTHGRIKLVDVAASTSRNLPPPATRPAPSIDKQPNDPVVVATSLAFNRAGDMLAAMYADQNRIDLYDLHTNALARSIENVHAGSCVFADNSSVLICSSPEGNAVAIDAKTGHSLMHRKLNWTTEPEVIQTIDSPAGPGAAGSREGLFIRRSAGEPIEFWQSRPVLTTSQLEREIGARFKGASVADGSELEPLPAGEEQSALVALPAAHPPDVRLAEFWRRYRSWSRLVDSSTPQLDADQLESIGEEFAAFSKAGALQLHEYDEIARALELMRPAGAPVSDAEAYERYLISLRLTKPQELLAALVKEQPQTSAIEPLLYQQLWQLSARSLARNWNDADAVQANQYFQHALDAGVLIQTLRQFTDQINNVRIAPQWCTADHAYQVARQAIDANRPPEELQLARKLLAEVETRDPTFWRARLFDAIALENLKQYDQSSNEWKTLLARPDVPVETKGLIYSELAGIISKSQPKNQILIDYYTGKAIQTGPKEPEVYSARADILIRSERFDLAATDYQRALDLGSDRTSNYTSLARCDFALQRHDQALKVLSDMVNKHPVDPALWKAKADSINSYGDWRDIDLGLAAIKKAMELNVNPTNEDRHGQIETRGDLYLSRGDQTRAQTDFRAALQIRESIYARMSLGWSLVLSGQHEAGMKEFDAVVQNGSANGWVYHRRSLLRDSQGDTNGAMDDINHAVKLNDAYLGDRATFYGKLGRFDEAEHDLNQLMISFPYTYRVWGPIAYAKIELARNHPAKAEEWLKKAASYPPISAEEYDMCALIAAYRKQFQLPDTLLDTAQRMDSADPIRHSNRASVLAVEAFYADNDEDRTDKSLQCLDELGQYAHSGLLAKCETQDDFDLRVVHDDPAFKTLMLAIDSADADRHLQFARFHAMLASRLSQRPHLPATVDRVVGNHKRAVDELNLARQDSANPDQLKSQINKDPDLADVRQDLK